MMFKNAMLGLLVYSLFGMSAAAQQKGALKVRPQSLNEAPAAHDVPERVKICNQIFKSFQEGILSNNIGLFSSRLASQVYVNLRGGESGYYSENQVHYVLENYLRGRRLANFEFTTTGESDSNPYATGSAVFVVKGTREVAQMYVALSQVGDRWVITQINIY